MYEWKFTLYGVGYPCDEFQPISTSSISLLTIHVHKVLVLKKSWWCWNLGLGSGRPSSSSTRLKSCNVQTKNDETMEQLFINNMPKIPSKSSNQASIFRMPSLNNNTGQTFFTKPFFIRSLLSVSTAQFT